jgi:hypothetical protein
MELMHAKAISITVLLLVGLLVESSCARSGLAIHNDASKSPSDAVYSDGVATTPLPDAALSDTVPPSPPDAAFSDTAPPSPPDALATSADIAAYHEDSVASAATVAIEPGLASYSGIMSSVPGLPLKAVAGGAAPANPLYRWRTDYGSFCLWGSSDRKVTDQGNDFTVGETTVYWGYDIPADTSASVLIRVDLLGDNAQPLASSTLTLSWTAQGGVMVN